jgi:hypothetical protein
MSRNALFCIKILPPLAAVQCSALIASAPAACRPLGAAWVVWSSLKLDGSRAAVFCATTVAPSRGTSPFPPHPPLALIPPSSHSLGHMPTNSVQKLVPVLFSTPCETVPMLGRELGEHSPSLIDIVNMCSPDGAEIIRKRRRTPGAPACPLPMDAWGVAGCTWQMVVVTENGPHILRRAVRTALKRGLDLWVCASIDVPRSWLSAASENPRAAVTCSSSDSRRALNALAEK